ncbi:MAG: hypothetical protein ABI615_01705 [Chthoniobacterales bacterium]
MMEPQKATLYLSAKEEEEATVKRVGGQGEFICPKMHKSVDF